MRLFGVYEREREDESREFIFYFVLILLILTAVRGNVTEVKKIIPQVDKVSSLKSRVGKYKWAKPQVGKVYFPIYIY